MFPNMIFDDFRNKAVECTPAGGCLLQHISALPVTLDRAFHRLDLAAYSFHTIEQFSFLFRDMIHGCGFTIAGGDVPRGDGSSALCSGLANAPLLAPRHLHDPYDDQDDSHDQIAAQHDHPEAVHQR